MSPSSLGSTPGQSDQLRGDCLIICGRNFMGSNNFHSRPEMTVAQQELRRRCAPCQKLRCPKIRATYTPTESTQHIRSLFNIEKDVQIMVNSPPSMSVEELKAQIIGRIPNSSVRQQMYSRGIDNAIFHFYFQQHICGWKSD
jgi:hypothetical protein